MADGDPPSSGITPRATAPMAARPGASPTTSGGRRFVLPAQFPTGVFVTADVLGNRTAVEFGGTPAVVHVPRCGAEVHGELVAPDVPAGDQLLRQSGSHAHGAPFFESWGQVTHSDASVPLGAVVETVALEIPSLRAEQTADVRREAEVWINRLVRWIEVLSRQAVRLGFRTSGTHPVVGNDWIDITSEPATRVRGTINVQCCAISGGLTLADWSRACDHASRATDPPLAQLILADARDALLKGDERRAVIDAATAVEIAVSDALRSALGATMPPELMEAVMRRTWQIGARVDLARAAGLSISSDLESGLLKERNEVVHRGASPTDARRSFTLADDVVQSLAP